MAPSSSDPLAPNGRAYLEAAVAERARHDTAEEVRTTCSFARAERLLGREYHGRFLIELLQNAADAWLGDPRSSLGRSRVAVVIGAGPALLVANEGAVLTADVVVESLGHIGASTKSEGEAIGHKGIGFKSVLEISHAPEIYSGLQDDEPALAVTFDPRRARASILEASPRWDELLASVQGLDLSDELAAVPVLRFPHWVDELPSDVAALAADGFDTVIRLPLDPGIARRRGLSEDAWLAIVRDALGDVSDQILLLLGCFAEVQLVDRRASSDVTIRPEWRPNHPPGSKLDGGSEDVRVIRNGVLSSSWRVFRRALPDERDLAGEVAVALRFDPSSRPGVIVPAVDGGPSAPFHLFFPTRITSGLPFLLHGYFEVDAARTGFYRGSDGRNRTILDELADLVSDVVLDSAQDPEIDLASAVNLIADCGEPEDALAREFQAAVLRRLDDQRWIPVEAEDTAVVRECPQGLLVATPQLNRHIARVFSPAYVMARVSLRLPDPGLTDRAIELIGSRRRPGRRDLWDVLSDLCRPGSIRVWDDDAADEGFLALLDLLAALDVEDRAAALALIEQLRGDPDSRLLPVPVASGGRALLPVPDPGEGVAGRRSTLVMARARGRSGAALVPPEELDLAFLPEGLLGSEADIDRAKPLGVRPFTVDNVLDRLNGIGQSGVDPERLLRFLWQLLSRERTSAFGTNRSAEGAVVFDPSQWFWCRPRRAREDDTSRLRQQRERYLADVPLPSRAGGWRPAGSLGFGSDWAEWLESAADGEPISAAAKQRAAAYRALDAICPGPESLLASPAVILPLLEDDSLVELLDPGPPGVEGEGADESTRDAERHAFLLRLGVWEVPPIEAFESRDRANRNPFPWAGDVVELQRSAVAAGGGWTFGLGGWGGARHENVHLAEDYRFAWRLDDAAIRDAAALATGLRLGARLYADRLVALVFCPGCSNSGSWHTTWRENVATDRYPSCLALQLHHDPWLMCELDGTAVQRPVAPRSAWWREKPLAGAGLRQSPWRLVPLCGPASGVTEELRRLARVNSLGDASLPAVGALLRDLRTKYESGTLVVDPVGSGSARQAFVGLHRLAYERLAELAGDDADEVAALLGDVGVLCEFGDGLVYRPPEEARHDDGRFSSYVRHFVGKVPLVVLPRDQDARAARIGVNPLLVHVTRRGGSDGEDVTDELRGMLADRIPELLAIVVHHGLGTQTLELSSVQFDERARRLQALSVRRVSDLVIDATVDCSTHSVTLGEGSDQDVFLENPTSTAPVLFHDLTGDGWQDRLRRKIAPHVAAVLQNTAYTHTFALFLQAETDAEREEFLLELGISTDEVDGVAARTGVVGVEEQQRHLRWYRAVLSVLGHEPDDLTLDDATLATALAAAGLPNPTVGTLVEAGGGENVRREVGPGTSLRLLSDAGVNLADLHNALQRAGDPGLAIAVTRRRFARWVEVNGRRLAVVLATQTPAETAKSSVRALKPSASLALSIDPPTTELLQPVADILTYAGFRPDRGNLAHDAPAELARLGGFTSVEDLDAGVLLLFDLEEQRRVLQERTARWRREIRMLAVLSRMGPAETRSTIRSLDARVGAVLSGAASVPSDLAAPVDELFFEHAELRDWLAGQLTDSVLSDPTDRDELLERAGGLGVAIDLLPLLERALEVPRRDQARAIKMRTQRLGRRGLVPLPPAGLTATPPRDPKVGTPGPKRVALVKVEASHDRRKRDLGDEGEQWALAAVLGPLLGVSDEERGRAIDQVCELLLGGFTGGPVDAALVHADLARSRGIDEEELIDELTGLLHVSRHSDSFGFDLIGWLPTSPGGAPRAVCLEVKSSSTDGFHLSTSEWALAHQLHDAGKGDRYAVLVVRRGTKAGPPARLDLLVDPVGLHQSGQLSRGVDGYTIAYSTQTTRSAGATTHAR